MQPDDVGGHCRQASPGGVREPLAGGSRAELPGACPGAAGGGPCPSGSASCRAANAGVFIMNDLLPLNRLPLNKANAIILSSFLTVSIEGIGGKVEEPFLLFEDILGGEVEVTIRRF